jgi:hypothetical protein
MSRADLGWIAVGCHRPLLSPISRGDSGQNFVILSNYQIYADAFALMGRERMRAGHPNGDAFFEPGNVVTHNARLGGSGPPGVPPERMPQMPAFHLVEPESGGTTSSTRSCKQTLISFGEA